MAMLVDPVTRDRMRKQIFDVLAQTGNYDSDAKIQQSTLDFEAKIFRSLGASLPSYQSSIEGKLAKVKAAFVPEGFENERKELVEWFNAERKLIIRMHDRKDVWKADACADIAQYLEGPLNVKHINMKKLGDLKAVREEFKRIKAIMSARAQELENAKKSALPAIDALQELVTCVERASVCMSDALAPSTISSEGSSGDKKTCGHLNFVQLQDCLTLMFNYLTPFHMSASRRSAPHDVCRICADITVYDPKALAKKCLQLQEHKFDWQCSKSEAVMRSGKVTTHEYCVNEDESVVEELSGRIMSSMDTLYGLYLQPHSTTNPDPSSMPKCRTCEFLVQNQSRVSQLNGWLQDLLCALRRSVLNSAPEKSEADSQSRQQRTKTESRSMMAKVTDKDDTSSKLNFNFNDKRALNIENCNFMKKKKKLKAIESSDYSFPESVGPFLSLTDVIAALEQQHKVHVVPVVLSASNRISTATVCSFRLQFSLQTLIRNCEDHLLSQLFDDNKVCDLNIEVDESCIPLSISINASSSSQSLPFQPMKESPISIALSLPQHQNSAPQTSLLQPINRQMNEFLSLERAQRDLSPGILKSATAKHGIIYDIFAMFVSRFKLSSPKCGGEGNDITVDTAEVSSASPMTVIRIDEASGFPQVSFIPGQ